MRWKLFQLQKREPCDGHEYATSIAERAFKKFLPNVNDHDTSDSAYQQRRPLSVSVAPRSATPGPRSTSAIREPPATFSSAAGRTSSRPPPTSSSHSISILGPCGAAKTTNKVPTSVKQEEPEVPNKDPNKFQTLKLSAQSSSSVAPDARTLLVGPLLCHQDPVPALDRGSRQHHRQAAWWNPLNRLAIRRRLSFGVTVHDCRSASTRSGSRARKSWT